MRRALLTSCALVSLAALVAGGGMLSATATPGGAQVRSTAPRFTTVPVRGATPPSIGGGILGHGPNVNITNKSGAQSETSTAVNPTNKMDILATSNDLAGTSQVYESLDGGLTWANANVGLTSFCYDPWLDFNKAGDAFFSYECSPTESIAYRKHGTNTWVKASLPQAGSFPDRDMVVVDTSGSSPKKGHVYIGYDDANASNAAYVLYSSDGFGSWTRSPKINDAGNTIGVNASVAPDGTLYAVWEDYPNKRIMIDKSTNGGQTWGTDHLVQNYRLPTGNFFICIPPQQSRCVVPMAFSTVAGAGTQHPGRIYVTFPDLPASGTGWRIFVTYSDDGGSTWSTEKDVYTGPNATYAFFPAIAVTKIGTVGVSFYDTRDDPSVNHKTNRYAAFSKDGGATWLANVKITTAQTDETVGFDANQYGDYEGMDAIGKNKFYAVWTDKRTGNLNEEIYGAYVKPD
jgi:hypothetical protein